MARPEDVWTLRDIAEYAGVHPTTTKTWVYRHKKHFPQPWRKGLPGGDDLYLAREIREWLARERPAMYAAAESRAGTR